MNRSFPPSSGVMNPYPFASLNHFTVPVAIIVSSSLTNSRTVGEAISPPVHVLVLAGQCTRLELRCQRRRRRVGLDIVREPESRCNEGTFEDVAAVQRILVGELHRSVQLDDHVAPVP